MNSVPARKSCYGTPLLTADGLGYGGTDIHDASWEKHDEFF